LKYRKLDENGDYVLGTGQDFLVNSPEAVGQAIKTRLLLLKGEWFVDTDDGLPQDQILGKYTSSKDTLIKQRILETQGVSEIISYSSNTNPNTREYTFTATVNTIYGQTTVNQTL